MMYYVYRFLDKKKNIIYVGKTKQDLEQRFATHAHLPSACYELTYRIEYIQCATESDMAIKELYYINRFRHDDNFFNVLDIADVPVSVEFNDKWKQYKGPLGQQFSNSINYKKGYTAAKEIRYNKDGSLDRRRPNSKAGVSCYVEALTPDEVNLVVDYLIGEINSAQNANQERTRFRNLVMFVLSVNLPHKANELITLRYRDLFDVNDCPKAVDLVLGRYHKDEIVQIPLRDNTKQVLMAYTEKYGITYSTSADDNIFQSRQNRQSQTMSGRSWWRILTDTAKKVGIDKSVGTETPRKTFAFNIYNRSDDKLKALLFLGEIWGAVRETQIISYLGLTDGAIDFDYYFGETFVLGEVDISQINCIN